MFQDNNQKDFSRMLKTILEADAMDPTAADPTADPSAPPAYPPAPRPAKPVVPGAAKQSPRGITKLIETIVARVNRQIEIFDASMTDLDRRFSAKMATLTSSASGDSQSLERLRTQLSDIQQQYQDKSREVDAIIAKVQEVLPSLAGTPAEEMISKIGEGLAHMKTELEGKAQEIEELTQSLSSSRSSHVADIEELTQKMYELDDYVQEVEQKLEAAKDRIKSLEKAKTRLATGKFDPEGLPDLEKKEKVPSFDTAHYKPYGDFDILEHLKRAKAKTKKNASDW